MGFSAICVNVIKSFFQIMDFIMVLLSLLCKETYGRFKNDAQVLSTLLC